MTGFASKDGEWGQFRWTWELKSVNSKGLDVRYRLPGGFDGMDRAVKKTVADHLGRGNVNCSLSVDSTAEKPQISINEDALEQALNAAQSAAERHGPLCPD